MHQHQRQLSLLSLLLTAVLLSGAAGCASDETKIKRKVKQKLDACKKAEGETYEVSFDAGKPYHLYKTLCEEPIENVRIVDELDGFADVGPYTFELRKNLSDNRWLLTRIRWEEFDEARSIQELATPSDSDLDRALKLLARAEKQAPTIEEIKTSRLDILLDRRKDKNKQEEEDKTSLGQAKSYFEKAVAAAKEQNNPDLEMRLRLQVIDYYDRFRQLAEDSSTPSEQAAEWEQAAIKAVEKEMKEAKEAGKDELYKKKKAEVEKRKREAEENVVRRQEQAHQMGKLAKKLKQRECAEIKAARSVDAGSKLRTELDSYASGLDCQ